MTPKIAENLSIRRYVALMGHEYGETGSQVPPRSGVISPRPWLMVWFRCAAKYQRVHRSPDGSRYDARCPSCGKALTFLVGDSGTSQRLFEADCGQRHR
ncbi:MAG: hypothetical protein HBSAPP03_00790 [Phycisphaerae bacterium]|nr:MAG: hypothetical protein HBSAPP03_00790 [Phycisphaerae bacterium]